jgi:hypothetical protein
MYPSNTTTPKIRVLSLVKLYSVRSTQNSLSGLAFPISLYIRIYSATPHPCPRVKELCIHSIHSLSLSPSPPSLLLIIPGIPSVHSGSHGTRLPIASCTAATQSHNLTLRHSHSRPTPFSIGPGTTFARRRQTSAVFPRRQSSMTVPYACTIQLYSFPSPPHG